MAFADLSLGVVSLLYSLTISASNSGQLDWNGEDQKTSLYFLLIFDIFFLAGLAYFGTLISFERFHAIFLPVKHRTLSTRVYTSVIFTVWTLALLISANRIALNLLLSYKHNMFIWGPHTLILVSITCGCNPW